QMGGPVKIVSTYYQLFTIPSGWRLGLWFSVILNVNLALMNLIPFPVFDGGHIVMGIGEMIRRKSVLPWVIMEKVQMACVVMLLGFFVYVTWFDTLDLVGNGKKKDTAPEIKIEDIQYPAVK
ncbi:MAG: regulator of sigma protease, partial [Verrucomicrobiaceae bacterium]|nr:regulator of sigma protease [Verrucomicrobiaceae bacterium]